MKPKPNKTAHEEYVRNLTVKTTAFEVQQMLDARDAKIAEKIDAIHAKLGRAIELCRHRLSGPEAHYLTWGHWPPNSGADCRRAGLCSRSRPYAEGELPDVLPPDFVTDPRSGELVRDEYDRPIPTNADVHLAPRVGRLFMQPKGTDE